MKFILFLSMTLLSMQINAQSLLKGTDLSNLLFEALKSEYDASQGGISFVKLVNDKYIVNDFTGNSIACFLGKVGDFLPAFMKICEVKVSKKEDATRIAGIIYRHMKSEYEEGNYSIITYDTKNNEYKIKDRVDGNSIMCKEVRQGENLPASRVTCVFDL